MNSDSELRMYFRVEKDDKGYHVGVHSARTHKVMPYLTGEQTARLPNFPKVIGVMADISCKRPSILEDIRASEFSRYRVENGIDSSSGLSEDEQEEILGFQTVIRKMNWYRNRTEKLMQERLEV